MNRLALSISILNPFVSGDEGSWLSKYMECLLVMISWCTVLFVVCHKDIHWKSRGFASLPGQGMRRLRTSLAAAMAAGLGVGIWTTLPLNCSSFGAMGLPFALLVGISYGVAWEGWI